jgi:hypothetical protein
MTLTLPGVVHDHHDALMPHVDALAAIAEAIGTAPADELPRDVSAQHAFIVGQLLPHIEQAEATLYPELERLLQNRHSMAPMRREHETLRAMVAELGELLNHPVDLGVQFRLRRLLYQMYALLKVHLAEEESYARLLAHNLAPDQIEELARGLAHATVCQPM